MSSPDTIETALRNGDEKNGLRADTLEKIVMGRRNLEARINRKDAELETAALSDIADLSKERLALQDDCKSMIDLGIAYQDLVDQREKLED